MDLEEDKRYGNSSSFGRYGVPCSSMQPSLAGGNSLRGEEKKQTSRCNLGVKWMVGIAAFAAIAFIRRRLSGHATLELIRATLSQRCRRCQLSFKDLCTVWPSGLVMRARSRARRRCCGTVARWDRLHVSMAPEEPAGGHGGALPLACPLCLGSGKSTI